MYFNGLLEGNINKKSLYNYNKKIIYFMGFFGAYRLLLENTVWRIHLRDHSLVISGKTGQVLLRRRFLGKESSPLEPIRELG